MCHIFASRKSAGEESFSKALDKCGSSILDEDIQVPTKKDANGRIVAGMHTDGFDADVVPPHEKECTESVQEMFEDLTRRDQTQKMQAEKQPRVKNPIDFGLSRACNAGRNNIKAWWRCNKVEWFAKKI